MKRKQFEEISKWQEETFGQATALSKIAHLKQEIEELKEELEKTDEPPTKALLEFADCFILLFGAANSFGMNYTDIIFCIQAKMNINKKRKWGKPDENGVVNHLKE